MRGWQVCATNRYFWQTLRVTARNKDVAAKKFAAYLKSRSSTASERFEMLDGEQLEGFRRPRHLFRYGFDADDIEEIPIEDASIIVEMAASGGNGS